MSMSILKNKKILITAGPTREAIDPVRYISNHSSGKMGYAIAEAFLNKGASVILISGPVNLQLKHPDAKVIPVTSALEMQKACLGYFNEIDIAVFAAAVADYRPQTVADRKIKKAGNELCIKLVKNPDIAFEFGRLKRTGQLSIGFALETNDELMNAESKLLCKNFDMVILNSMNDAGAAFGYDTNKITIIQEGMATKEFPVKKKTDVADDILREIAAIMQNQFVYKEGMV